MSDGFENLSKDVQEYIARRVDNLKMTMAEELSIMMGDMLAYLVLFFMLFAAFLFVLAGAVAALAQVIGFVYAMMLAAAAIAVAALAVYFFRTAIFVNTIVKHLCRLLSVRKEVGNE
jgi:fatty acid desaturase